MNSIENLPNNVFSSLKNLQGLYVYINYSTRHKSLKQEPFVLNFFKISYIHPSHLFSHSNVPLSSLNVEPRVFWNTEMTNQHWGGKITQVFQGL